MYQFPEELRKAYESMQVPFAVYQKIDNRIDPILVSDGLCAQLEVSREKLLPLLKSSKFDGMHPDDAGRIKQVTLSFAERESDYNVVFRSRHPDGYHVIHSTGYWCDLPGAVDVALLTYQDITNFGEDFVRMEETYHFFRKDHFYRDPLTGLPNINYFQEFADERVQAIRLDGKTPMLIYSDVNSMQFYNNQYGFAKGNDLLCLVAETLNKTFPGSFLTRGADDHFLLIDVFPGEQEVDRLLTGINRQIRMNAPGNTTGIQSGVVELSGKMNVFQGMDHARNALKRIGSDLNRIFRIYSPQKDAEYWNQRYIVENLDRALGEHWIRVFYQGICRMQTGKTAAFEALARWNDPARGTISPGDFIPVLEKYHLLYKLDLYMVKQVLLELNTRLEANLPLLPVSVNFSAQDFDYCDIPEEIESLYHSTGADQLIPRSSLIVEITEQDMATATESFHEQLKRLRSLGYQLWLDDFGSGYSSLNVFSRFEVDLIKFDMALIQHLDDRGGINREIIKAMVSIAQAMGIQTLAEGLETEEQKEFLQSAGCDLGQGFLFRRPVSLDTILYIVRGESYVGRFETDAERKKFGLQELPPQTES